MERNIEIFWGEPMINVAECAYCGNYIKCPSDTLAYKRTEFQVQHVASCEMNPLVKQIKTLEQRVFILQKEKAELLKKKKRR